MGSHRPQTLNGDYNARLEACALLEKAAAHLIRKVVRAKRKEEKKARKAGAAPPPKSVTGKRKSQPRPDAYPMQDRGRASADIVDARRSDDSARTAVAERAEDPFKDASASVESVPASARARHSRTATSVLEAGQLSAGAENGLDAEALLERYAPPKKRPRHRLGFLGVLGKKVDTIEWCKVRAAVWPPGPLLSGRLRQDEIARLNTSIAEERAALAQADKTPKPLGSAFIQCNLQMGAHVLAQCVSYHKVRLRPYFPRRAQLTRASR